MADNGKEYWYEVVHVEKHRVTRLIKAPNKKRAIWLAGWGDAGRKVRDVRDDFVTYRVTSAKKVRGSVSGYKFMEA